jgi:hypothetical protein
MLQATHEGPNLMTHIVHHPSLPILFLLLLFLVWRWVTVPRDKGRVEYLLVLCLVVSPVCYLLMRKALAMITNLCPVKYDLYAYEFGTWFGSPSFQMRTFALNHHWFMLLTKLTYDMVYLAIIGTVAAYLWLGTKQEARRVLNTFGLNLLIAPFIYILIPIAGPRYAFPEFPSQPAAMLAQPIVIAAAPKGIPALHLSMALLALWFLRRWWWGRVGGGIYAALMVLTVLANGEHYLLDVFGSLPYTAMIYYFGKPGVAMVYGQERREEMLGRILGTSELTRQRAEISARDSMHPRKTVLTS